MIFTLYFCRLTNITPGEATVIALIVLCTILLLLLNLCWQQCRRNEKTIDDMNASREQPADGERSMVFAREVRPGLVLVQGSPNAEETKRLVNEYDMMKASGKSEGSMFSYPYRDQPPEYVQVYGGGTTASTSDAAAPHHGVVALVPHADQGSVARMTAPSGESRPPAYAPGHTYGSVYPHLH